MNETFRLGALVAAEKKAFALLDAIEEAGLVTPGRTERAVEQDILRLAQDRFGIEKHWHKRIVRAGSNAVCTASDNPPVRTIEADDTVFLDLGPVFEEWEADVGRTYALGSDPEKHRLCADLERIFESVRQRFLDDDAMTGAALYAIAQQEAADAGWLFGGTIAGHLVGEFPHARIPGDKDHYRISPTNLTRMRDPDALGHAKHWILEIHLVSPDRRFGGFYERLLLPAA